MKSLFCSLMIWLSIVHMQLYTIGNIICFYSYFLFWSEWHVQKTGVFRPIPSHHSIQSHIAAEPGLCHQTLQSVSFQTFPQVHLAGLNLPLAATLPLFPKHWGAQVLAASSLHGTKVIFWWDDSSLCNSAARHSIVGLGSSGTHRFLGLHSWHQIDPANCSSSPSQMFMQPPIGSF